MVSAHTTVLLDEAVSALIQDRNGVYIDGTFGRGGHSAAVLQQLGDKGRLIAIDRDPAAIAVGKTWTDARFSMVHGVFSDLETLRTQLKLPPMDGVLLDIGVSSPQFDEAARGFSFSKDAPLDMRMDTSDSNPGMNAAQWLNQAKESEIRDVIQEYGEERHAARIAAHIVAFRTQQPIATTGQLAQLVEKAVTFRQAGHHPATRTFQAIRIHINQELQELARAISQAEHCIKVDGRLAVISFHSLEDRIVKQAFRPAPVSAAERHLPRSEAIHPWREILKIKPSAAECKRNPRARSAVLRVAQRMASTTPIKVVS